MPDDRELNSSQAQRSRTPLDLWWLPVLAITVAAISLDWATSTTLVVSVAAATILALAHLLTVRRRSLARRRSTEVPSSPRG